jgi:hypothetical protein
MGASGLRGLEFSALGLPDIKTSSVAVRGTEERTLMYIGYFDYDGTTYYCGYMASMRATNYSSNISKVRGDLDVLNSKLKQPHPGNAATRASFVQALVRRKLDIADNGALVSSNYFPETLIVEFRLERNKVETKFYAVFLLKKQELDVVLPTLEDAVASAERIHKLATLDSSKWQDMAEGAGLLP